MILIEYSGEVPINGGERGGGGLQLVGESILQKGSIRASPTDLPFEELKLKKYFFSFFA